MAIKSDEIKEFWDHFEILSGELLKEPEDETLVDNLDQMVNKLGDFGWELGPSRLKDFYFCLSANWSEELLQDILIVIASAPNLPHWEIIAGKPKKDELLSQFNILNEKGEEILVDTNNWRCMVYKFSDGTYDIDVKVDKVDGDQETKSFALDIHLTNLLGEAQYLNLIKGIKFIDSFDSKLSNKVILVNDIASFIA